MFFRQIIEAFLVRTAPDSSMVNPAHIHITSEPQTRNAKVLKTNRVSSSTPAACATAGRARNSASVRRASPAVTTVRLRFPKTWDRRVSNPPLRRGGRNPDAGGTPALPVWDGFPPARE